MVNNHVIGTEQARAERRLVLSYAPPAGRAGAAALLALDNTLAAILRSTRDPMVGQLRLTWWHDALTQLDGKPAPAEPVLRALQRDVMPHATGAELAAMVDGWEELLDPTPLDDARLARFAEARGAGLFRVAGAVLGAGPGDPVAPAGRGWALVNLAHHVGNEADRACALKLAAGDLQDACARRWTSSGRMLGAMAHLSRTAPDAGSRRVARALWHRLTGR